ncbi:uncharacterized protein [Malus domestica]|uniref:uncharacterized protein n=1 Tax=Malus domestica TaxID=3750 RepID=UPI003974C514
MEARITVVDSEIQSLEEQLSLLKAEKMTLSNQLSQKPDRIFAIMQTYFSRIVALAEDVKYCAIWKEREAQPYIGPYQIVEQVDEVAYRLALPPELVRVHNMFHVSLLRRCVSDPSLVIPPQPLEINPDLTYDKVSMTILDWKDKVLRNKTVQMVKVLWRNHSVEEATWETKECMRDIYPRLFYGFDGNQY